MSLFNFDIEDHAFAKSIFFLEILSPVSDIIDYVDEEGTQDFMSKFFVPLICSAFKHESINCFHLILGNTEEEKCSTLYLKCIEWLKTVL